MIPAAALILALIAAAPEPAGRMVLKNGTVYVLKEPPRISGGRIVFTTVEGKVYSLAESEVVSITGPATPTPAPRGYSTQDSRALGAIARQQRNRKGKSAEVAPGAVPTPRPPRKHKITRTATPRPS